MEPKRISSIKEKLIFLGGSFTLLLLLAFITMFVNYSDQQKLHNRFLTKTNNINRVLVVLGEMQNTLHAYRKDLSPTTCRAYQSQMRQLDEAVDSYLAEGSVDKDSLNQMQYLQWFNGYQEDLLEEGRKNRDDIPAIITYILTALEARAGEMHILFQHEIATNYDTCLREERSSFTRMAWLVAISIVICIGLIIAFSRFILSLKMSLSRSNDNLDHLSRHDWSVGDLGDARNTEFVELFSRINHMKRELQEYVVRLKRQTVIERQLGIEKVKNERQRTMLATTQLRALRAQMNPHFLFNALQQIGVASLVESPQKVMQLVEATGKILRYSLTVKTNFVPLREELEIVRQYLSLQTACHDRRIVSEIDDGSGSFDTCQIPPMSIQPVVENCIKHGFREGTEEPFRVTISFSREDDILIVSVRDNGVGMNVSSLSQKQNSGGIGLSNIKQRLSILYGEGDLVSVESETGSHTMITIRFPQKRRSP